MNNSTEKVLLMEKHPKSLSIFFTTEMWERYGFYVVQSLLALFLAFHFQLPDKHIYALVGSFTALTYLCPLVGGWIADKLIGQKRAILLGAFVLLCSYCLLSLMTDHASLTFALAGIAVGTGLLKPNISSLLGNAYLTDSPSRESGFTIFYMGITSGIILGTTLPSLLNAHFGWTATFMSASLGITIALSVFIWGIIKYDLKDYNVYQYQFKNIIITFILLTALWGLCFYILNSPQLANLIFGGVVLFSALYILYSVNRETPRQSLQTLVIGLLCIISVIFWSFYFQMFMSWTLFISRVVKPTFLGIQFPPPYFITIQSIGMLIIGFFLSKKYVELSLVERGVSIGKKFLLAIVFTTLSYAIISLASSISSYNNMLIPPLLIIPAYLLFSLAELFLSPVGLAAITILADKNKVSTMMGIFFVSLGIGGFLAGKLATITAIPPHIRDLDTLKIMYAHAFTQQLGILFVAALFCLILFTVIKFLLTKVETIKE